MKAAATLVASALAAGLAVLALNAYGQAPAPSGGIPMDTPTVIGGVETVCTGIGVTQRQNPQWATYPVRVEFANAGAQHVLGAHVDLMTGAGKPLASLDCHGPLVLFRLEPGSYKVMASLFSQPGGTASATFTSPRTGQKRVVLTFNVGPNQ